MADEKKPKVAQNPKIGFCSRIDYGSKGFRRGILEAGYDHFKREGAHFIALAGGLISQKAIAQRVKDFTKTELRKDKVAGRKYEDLKRFKDRLADKKVLKSELLPMRKRELKNQCLEQVAKELASLIPSISVPDPEDPTKTKCVDLYIMTSPAFDGEDGEFIAHRLAELRDDVRVYNAGGDRIDVKYVNKMIWVLTPQKSVWMRGDYYSTAVERVIKDKVKSTSQSSPVCYVVGCMGASINKPMGELKYAYVSVPNFSRIEETRVAENQIGVSVMEFPLDGGQYLFRTHSLKDLVSKELSFIVAPPKSSALQKQLVEIIKNKGWATAGIARNELLNLGTSAVSREEIVTAIEKLDKKKTVRRKGENWPGITYQEGSKKYYFDLEWVQRRLKYQLEGGPYAEDAIVSAACVHAGSTETDYHFLVNDVPALILARRPKIFVVCGDLKEGTKHNLVAKGEVIAGANKETVQDKMAAHFLGTVVWKVFLGYFEENIAPYRAKDGKVNITAGELMDVVVKSFIDFIYWLGNHDTWESEDGHEPLEVFHLTLVDLLADQLAKHLNSFGNLPNIQVREIVQSKVMRREFFELPSGLRVSLQHPFMSRAKTTSIRPQEMMDYGKRHGCQVTIGANFHVGENVEEWDQNLGQCVSQEIGTIKHGSNFERRKMKMVDQGVGYLRIVSKNKRILMTESAYYGAKEVRPQVDNLEILNAWIEKMGVPPIQGIPISGEPLKS